MLGSSEESFADDEDRGYFHRAKLRSSHGRTPLGVIIGWYRIIVGEARIILKWSAARSSTALITESHSVKNMFRRSFAQKVRRETTPFKACPDRHRHRHPCRPLSQSRQYSQSA